MAMRAGWPAFVTESRLEEVRPYPLDVLVAETQGMIGYMLARA
jgi:carbamate kinase